MRRLNDQNWVTVIAAEEPAQFSAPGELRCRGAVLHSHTASALPGAPLTPGLCSVDHSQPPAKLPQRYTFGSNQHFPAPETKSTGPDNARQVQHNPGTQEGPISAIPQPLTFPNRWAVAKCSFWCHFLLLWITSMKRMPLLRCLSILWSLPHGITGLQ